jgi:uncharacterized protein involved in oxidation of intracellular sulfur
MKIGIVVYSCDYETVWNAFRFGNFALKEKDEVKIFLLAKGVECEALDADKVKVTEQMRSFVDNGGKIFACGMCLLSTMKDLYEMIKWKAFQEYREYFQRFFNTIRNEKFS